MPKALMIAALAWLGSMQCHAADAPPVETSLLAEVRESQQDSSRRVTFRYVPATRVAQGQVVYYTLRIRNPAAVAVRDVVVIQRIPANTIYVVGSASGPGVEISLSKDGGQTFHVESRSSPVPLAAPDATANLVLAAECTHIRWRLRNALAPGATALARFRAVFR